jgi:hypothetical protein
MYYVPLPLLLAFVLLILQYALRDKKLKKNIPPVSGLTSKEDKGEPYP